MTDWEWLLVFLGGQAVIGAAYLIGYARGLSYCRKRWHS